MNEQENTSLMDASGLGLLPGIVTALFLVVLAMAALLMQTWWIVAVLMVFLIATTAVIVAVVVAAMGEPGDRLRRHIPGL